MDYLQELLDRVEAHNRKMNTDAEKTFLLPMVVAEGSPTHPAYPSVHAINANAYITTLKVIALCYRKINIVQRIWLHVAANSYFIASITANLDILPDAVSSL